MIVLESSCLEVGSLNIITCTGATIGREQGLSHGLLIPDINVSKVSASDVKAGKHRGLCFVYVCDVCCFVDALLHLVQ